MGPPWAIVLASGLSAGSTLAPTAVASLSAPAPMAAPSRWLHPAPPSARPWLADDGTLSIGERLRGRIDIERRADGARVLRITLGVALSF